MFDRTAGKSGGDQIPNKTVSRGVSKTMYGTLCTRLKIAFNQFFDRNE